MQGWGIVYIIKYGNRETSLRRRNWSKDLKKTDSMCASNEGEELK